MSDQTNKVKSKLPGVGDTIFAEMSAKTNKHDAINLSQGFPNFGTPNALIERVNYHMEAGHNQYPPMPGLPELKEKLSEKIEGLYGGRYDPQTELTITAGATQAIQMAITALVRKDDEVIMFEPAYDVYAPCVRLNGGKPRFQRLVPPAYQIDWNRVEEMVSPKTRLIILNTPHNPSGTVVKEEDMRRLSELVTQHELFVLSDEVYQHMVYEGEKHQSIARFPEIRKRGLAAYSFGKTYHATGWKVGYLAAPAELTKEFRKVFQYGMFAVSSPMQYAFSDYLDHSQHYLELPNFYQQKRDLFREILEASRLELLPCEGTYFQCASFEKISDESDIAFIQRLIEDYKVAAIPVSAFYHDRHDQQVIRFCFAKTRETLEKAGEQLIKV